MNESAREFTVEERGGERLDVYLAARIADLSRSSLQRLIDAGHVLVNASRPVPATRCSRAIESALLSTA